MNIVLFASEDVGIEVLKICIENNVKLSLLVLDIYINIKKINMPSELFIIGYPNFTDDNPSFRNNINWDSAINLKYEIEKTITFSAIKK